jgi:DNA-damage-inducible protein D
LKKIKGIEKSHDLHDYMGRAELAANLFRITMTEEKLKSNPSINTEKLAIETHKKVGSDVRKMVKENTGVFPEELRTERRLNEVSKELKKAKKLLNSKGI